MNTKQLVNRLLQIVLVLFGISFLTFCLTYLSPGDPAELMLVEGGTVPSEELLAETREQMGLNDPFLVQYGNWLKGFVTGDMGTSYSSKAPVSAVLLDCLGPTLELAAASLILMLVISIPLGILAAVYQNKFPDYLVRGLSFAGVSFPGFWIGLVLLYVFGLKLNWFPIATSGTGFMKLVLPAVTLAIAMSAKYTRQVRTAVLEELRQDYVAGARARALRSRPSCGGRCCQTPCCPWSRCWACRWARCSAAQRWWRLFFPGPAWARWQSTPLPLGITLWFRAM